MVGDMGSMADMMADHGTWHQDLEGCPQTLSETGSLSQRDIEG